MGSTMSIFAPQSGRARARCSAARTPVAPPPMIAIRMVSAIYFAKDFRRPLLCADARSVLLDDSFGFQHTQNFLGQSCRRFSAAVKGDFRPVWRFIRTSQTGEIRELPGSCQLIKALWVACLANLDRCIDVDLDELILVNEVARHPPFAAKRRNKAHQHDEAGFDHQLCHLSDASNILDAILVGEPEIAIEPMTDIVAVEKDGMQPR